MTGTDFGFETATGSVTGFDLGPVLDLETDPGLDLVIGSGFGTDSGIETGFDLDLGPVKSLWSS